MKLKTIIGLIFVFVITACSVQTVVPPTAPLTPMALTATLEPSPTSIPRAPSPVEMIYEDETPAKKEEFEATIQEYFTAVASGRADVVDKYNTRYKAQIKAEDVEIYFQENNLKGNDYRWAFYYKVNGMTMWRVDENGYLSDYPVVYKDEAGHPLKTSGQTSWVEVGSSMRWAGTRPVPVQDVREVVIDGQPVRIYSKYLFPGGKEVGMVSLWSEVTGVEWVVVEPTKVPEPQLSAAAIAEWDELNLDSKAEWKVQNIPGWGVGWTKETGEQIVVFETEFSNANGEKTMVTQLCYKTQTAGEGALTELACMDGHKDQQRLLVINGTDEKAKEWFKWMAEYPAVQDNNPQLLQAFRDAAEGKKKIVIVQGDLGSVPEKYRVDADVAIASGLKIEGVLAGVGKYFMLARKDPATIAVVPFTRGDTVFVVGYKDYQSQMDPFAPGNKGKSQAGIARLALTNALHGIFYLSVTGEYNVNEFTPSESGQYYQDLNGWLSSIGLIQEMGTIK
jgi:hypothetical protein